MKRQHLFVLLLLLLALSASLLSGRSGRAAAPSNPAAAVLTSPIAVTPDKVRWSTCSPALPAGAQCAKIEGDAAAADVLFTNRVKIPDGWRIGPHFHPADEHLTVISGTFNIGHGRVFSAAALTPLPAGSFAVMPKDHAHFATATGETIVQVHAIGPWGLTYVDPADDPRTK